MVYSVMVTYPMVVNSDPMVMVMSDPMMVVVSYVTVAGPVVMVRAKVSSSSSPVTSSSSAWHAGCFK